MNYDEDEERLLRDAKLRGVFGRGANAALVVTWRLGCWAISFGCFVGLVWLALIVIEAIR